MTPLKIELDDKAVQKVDNHLNAFKVDHATAEAKFSGIDIGTLAGLLAKICAAYAVAKPVINFIKKYLLIWKPSWQKVISGIQDAVDTACSIAPAGQTKA